MRRRLERPVVAAAQEDEQRLRVKRLDDRAVDQLGEARAIGGKARLIREHLEQPARIEGTAEEGAVETFGGRLPRALADEREDAAEDRAGDKAERQLIARHPRQHVHDARETQGHADADTDRQRDEPAPHQQIPRAAAQQHGDLHRAVLHDGVPERDRDGEERGDRADPEDERQLLRLDFEDARENLQRDDRDQPDEHPEEDHAALPSHVRRAEGVQPE